MKKHLPNIFTCLNLLTGCMALVMVFRNRPEMAAYLIFLAAFFDLMDGLLARKLNLHSAFGKELDSLADVISFGLVPGAVIFKLLQQSDLSDWDLPIYFKQILQFAPFLITVFSALRLAKFNLDQRQRDSFLGLPTPANTLLIVSLPMILMQMPGHFEIVLLDAGFLILLGLVLSFFLVSEIPLFALKFKDLSFRNNKYQYILILFGLITLLLFKWIAIPMIFVLYFILSIIRNLIGSRS